MDPPRADIRLGYICNQNCKFCCVSEQDMKPLSTQEVKKELLFAKENNLDKIVLTGGEPSIRKDIFEIIRFARELKFKDITMITNGGMCSYPEYFKKLVESGLTNLCFSIPHIEKQKYEYLTQVKGSFERLMQAIENAKKYDLIMSSITVITKESYKDLPLITKYLSNLNKHFKEYFAEFVLVNPTNNAWKYRNELVPKLSDIYPHIHESLEIAKQNNLILNIEGVPFCYMKGYEDNIVELHMAKKRMYSGPDEERNFQYNETRIVEGKSKSIHCKTCCKNHICEGVWKEYGTIYGLNELDYNKP